ncbi:MAG: putative bifunctional diguanylate cyclase/phosphodiesterase [Microthrixaceae bacterium]
MAIPVVAAVVAVGAARTIGGDSALAWSGALACVALAWTAGRAVGGQPVLAGQAIPLSVGVAVLALSQAGLEPVASTPSRSMLAILAYPFLGRAMVRVVVAHRDVREPDMVVESALVGTAAGIVLHVAVGGWRPDVAMSAWSDARSAFPVMLVALDVTVLVVAARAVRSPAARRGPVACLQVGLVSLFASHLSQVLSIAGGANGRSVSTGLAMVGFGAVALAALHPGAQREPDRLLELEVLFSATHAGVVVVALLAAPGVLAVQAARGVTVSATLATGAVVSGTILATYLVGLLRERAATEHQATHDGLTGLPNRALVVDRLDRSIAHARRSGGSCAVLFMDLDRFKEVNDTFGHAAGDGLLRSVAARLATCVRDEDTVARLSGDEFVILLPHLSSPEDVVEVTRRVLDSLSHPVTVGDQPMLLSGSIGVAVYPNDGGTADEVLANADAAMYRAKETSGSSWELFSAALSTQAQVRLQVEADLLTALARDEIVLHYQPIVDLATGRTVGAEGLARWNHPERGLLSPGEFVPIAEQSDLIVMLGERVILTACRELRMWHDLGLTDRFISVNVSSRQFNHGLVSTVASALRVTGANPRNLVIELTEGTVVDSLGQVAAALEELAAMGVRSAIDDFGTGYCGLRYLGSLPVASLKIDQSFIQGMTPSSAAIVAATIAMGHSLGLTLIAEGVETPEQRRFLTEHGCDRIQGYLVGRPMPSTELVDRLQVEGHDSEADTELASLDRLSERMERVVA